MHYNQVEVQENQTKKDENTTNGPSIGNCKYNFMFKKEIIKNLEI